MKENIQNGFNPSEWKNPVIQRSFNPDWIESALMFDPLRRADCAEIEFNKQKKSFLLRSKDFYTGKTIKFLIKPLSDDLVSVENMKTKEVKKIVLNNAENEHPDEDFLEFLRQGGVGTF